MTDKNKTEQYNHLITAFQKQIETWTKQYNLKEESLYATYEYEIKNIFVFNETLLNRDVENIKYIFVADNPGKKEQAEKAYLIGTAGKMARNFFARLGVNFDENIIVLNKTPIHTRNTHDLKRLNVIHTALLKETQQYMAQLTYNLHTLLNCRVYLFGFAGCRRSDGTWLYGKNKTLFKGQLTPYYYEKMLSLYQDRTIRDTLYLYKHISFGNFQKDVNIYQRKSPDTPIPQLLDIIGALYRDELFTSV